MYDYVIVGAGSAGCVLAARLSEDPDVRVLLLEAGGPDDLDAIFIPAAFNKLFKSPYDWDYATEPEPGADGRRIYLPRGRMLGGSSSMNAMVYIRGNRLDYDRWHAAGNPGWAYDEMLPYFKRAEHNERGADLYHGDRGPLWVCDGRSRNPMMDAWVQAALDAGLPHNPDFNGESQDGAGLYQVTQCAGKRCSAAVAYLHAALRRSNLELRTGATVARVLFEGPHAVGAEALIDGRQERLLAEREVILCGGAYGTPQILMLSGVGPAQHLREHGIDVHTDLPVGDDLQDHPAAILAWTTAEPVSLMTAESEENVGLFAEGRGPLTSNVAEAGAFVRTSGNLEAPDIQFHAAPVMFLEEGLAEPPDHGYSFGPCLLTPHSRGTVRLASADPTAHPRIQHNYYSAPEDMERMVAGVRLALEISRGRALDRYRRDAYCVPASDSEADIVAHVRATTQTLYHPAGTCAMGTVVDPELRVLGCEGLRVVDASVMPTVTRGNTNAPTIAIAERAADLVRADAPSAVGAAAGEAA